MNRTKDSVYQNNNNGLITVILLNSIKHTQISTMKSKKRKCKYLNPNT